MNRRNRLCASIVLGVFIIGLVSGAGMELLANDARVFHASGQSKAPNIIVILADDLGFGDVQCLNPIHGKIATPHLDRLAAQGMVFTEAHSSSAVCTPSRYSILTGRYGWRTRLTSGVLGGFSPPLLEPGRLTLPELLRQQGYHTACVGKWHLGMTMPGKPGTIMRDAIETIPSENMEWSRPIEEGPTTRGFDSFFGISASLDMPPFAFIENDRFTQLPNVVKKWIREGPAAPDFEAVDVLPACSLKAQEFIAARSRTGKPFFLFLSLTSPHTPIEVTREWQGKSGLGPYGDFVMQTDAVVGEIMAAVDGAGIVENTLFVFTSDNGYSPAAAVGAEHRPSADRRGFKADAWDGGHRVPLIVRWPARIPKGSRCDQLVCLIDCMATCADFLGVTLPSSAAEDSVSVAPLFVDPTRPVRDHLVNHSITGKFALREREWKLILSPGSGGWAAPTDEQAIRQDLPFVQLYHVEDDPGETKNLQAEHPERVRQMIARLRQLIDNGRSTPGPRMANDRPVDLWKLDTLPGVTYEQIRVYDPDARRSPE